MNITASNNPPDPRSGENPFAGSHARANVDRSLTGNQAESAAAALSKFWTGNPDRLKAALESHGLVEADDPMANASMDERRLQSAFGGAQPQDYDLNGLMLGRQLGGHDRTASGLALDQTLRSALSAMEVPKALGRSLAEDMLNSAQQFQASDADQDEHVRQYESGVARAIAAAHAGSRDEFFNVVKSAIAKMEPHTAASLEQAGAFESPNVLIQLYQQGRRLAGLAR